MDFINPYQLFGLNENASRHEIQCAYRHMIKMIHPDKIRHSGFKWTLDEQKEAYHQCRKAYLKLMEPFKEINVPDYEIEYEDFFDDSLKSSSSLSSSPPFDIDTFNKEFELQHEKIVHEGMEDPLRIGGWKKIDKNPKNGQEDDDTIQYTLLGLKDTPLLTTRVSNKNSIVGTDIQTVYYREKEFEVLDNRERDTSPNNSLQKEVEERILEREKMDIKYEHPYEYTQRKKSKWELDLEREEVQQKRDAFHTRLFLQNRP